MIAKMEIGVNDLKRGKSLGTSSGKNRLLFASLLPHIFSFPFLRLPVKRVSRFLLDGETINFCVINPSV